MSHRLPYAIPHALLASAIALMLTACQQQAPSTPAAQTAAPAQRAAAPATPPAATPPAASAAVADSTGVPECDDYLSKYQACVDSKVPEAARAALRQSLGQTRAAWRSAMTTPGGKNGMAAACTQARDAAKTSMAAYGCTNF